mgnify:CR=1 FL=1
MLITGQQLSFLTITGWPIQPVEASFNRMVAGQEEPTEHNTHAWYVQHSHTRFTTLLLNPRRGFTGNTATVVLLELTCHEKWLLCGHQKQAWWCCLSTQKVLGYTGENEVIVSDEDLSVWNLLPRLTVSFTQKVRQRAVLFSAIFGSRNNLQPPYTVYVESSGSKVYMHTVADELAIPESGDEMRTSRSESGNWSQNYGKGRYVMKTRSFPASRRFFLIATKAQTCVSGVRTSWIYGYYSHSLVTKQW